MHRRAFVRGSILALGAAPLLDASDAEAQRACRADWQPTGALTGREASDASALTDEERAHVPVLTLPRRVHAGRAFDLVVQIGVSPHEQRGEHRIDWIEVALDERRVVVADLSADVAFPILRVPIVLASSGVLVARARCTEHGVWLTRRSIEVAPP